MSFTSRVTNRTVVVTGGSRGVGFGLVKQFLDRGNDVVATTRQVKTADQLHSLAKESGERLRVTQLDTASVASIKEWATELKQHYDRIDVSPPRDQANLMSCMQDTARPSPPQINTHMGSSFSTVFSCY
eukprot:353950-Chlamydomonas_euryale.AAC.12